MGEREEAIIETKLGILIDDFHRFREEMSKHSVQETVVQADITKVQAEILTTLKWHRVIGSFMMVTLMYLMYNAP